MSRDGGRIVVEAKGAVFGRRPHLVEVEERLAARGSVQVLQVGIDHRGRVDKELVHAELLDGPPDYRLDELPDLAGEAAVLGQVFAAVDGLVTCQTVRGTDLTMMRSGQIFLASWTRQSFETPAAIRQGFGLAESRTFGSGFVAGCCEDCLLLDPDRLSDQVRVLQAFAGYVKVASWPKSISVESRTERTLGQRLCIGSV
jgi:hypothetical protein